MTESQTPPLDVMGMRRSRGYVVVLILAALVGAPIAAVAYFFQHVTNLVQEWAYVGLPSTLGMATPPVWWPVPLLVVAGLLVALSIDKLPGGGGHAPADGFAPSGAVDPRHLPGVVLAALATLALGAVLGPEAPLIAIGSGLGVIAVRLAKRDAPPQVVTVIAAAGSFAAISSLLGSPLVAAFLLMEAAGLAGPTLGLVLLPGLLAAGVGTLIYLGLDSLTGLGTFSLAVPDLPPFTDVTGVMFIWAVVFGIVAAVLGRAIRTLALALRSVVDRRRLLLAPLVGAAIALVAIVFAEVTGKGADQVLFSGESALAPLVDGAASWTVEALLLLILAKSLAYALSLSTFRGGPTFPAMFLGAAGGVAAAGLPGLDLVPAVAMGLAAMCAVMLQLPLTSVLLASLLLASDALQVMPLVIVAVVVAYVASARLPVSADGGRPHRDVQVSDSPSEGGGPSG